MTESLTIIHRDEHFVVVQKPSGLLSVPGRVPDMQDCIVIPPEGCHTRLHGTTIRPSTGYGYIRPFGFSSDQGSPPQYFNPIPG